MFKSETTKYRFTINRAVNMLTFYLEFATVQSVGKAVKRAFCMLLAPKFQFVRRAAYLFD